MAVIAFVWAFIAVALILIVLIQKGKGGGLGAALGGAGASSLLGTKTGDFLTWVTIALVGMFLILGVVLAKYFRPLTPRDLAAPAATTTPIDPTVVPSQPAPPDTGGTETPAPTVPSEGAPASQPLPDQPDQTSQ